MFSCEFCERRATASGSFVLENCFGGIHKNITGIRISLEEVSLGRLSFVLRKTWQESLDTIGKYEFWLFASC